MKRLEEIDLEELKKRLNDLSTASEKPIVYVETNEAGENSPVPVTDFKAIVNDKDGRVEDIVSKGYALIQHKDAFSAIVDALVAMKTSKKVRASILEDKGRSWLTVVFPEIKIDDGEQGIELGFTARNSYDRSSALTYSGRQRKFDKKGHFEFFGYRLSCKNGMTARIPMDFSKPVVEKSQAKVGDIVDVKIEKVYEEVRELDSVKTYIRHYGKQAEVNLEKLHWAILQLPEVAIKLEAMIKLVRNVSMTPEEAEKRLKEMEFSDRLVKKFMDRYKQEEQTQWGLYNAITTEATHGRYTDGREKSLSTMDDLLERAQKLLVVEVKA